MDLNKLIKVKKEDFSSFIKWVVRPKKREILFIIIALALLIGPQLIFGELFEVEVFEKYNPLILLSSGIYLFVAFFVYWKITKCKMEEMCKVAMWFMALVIVSGTIAWFFYLILPFSEAPVLETIKEIINWIPSFIGYTLLICGLISVIYNPKKYIFKDYLIFYIGALIILAVFDFLIQYSKTSYFPQLEYWKYLGNGLAGILYYHAYHHIAKYIESDYKELFFFGAIGIVMGIFGLVDDILAHYITPSGMSLPFFRLFLNNALAFLSWFLIGTFFYYYRKGWKKALEDIAGYFVPEANQK